MELLVASLVHTNPQRDVDVVARMHLIADSIRLAPGLVISSVYRNRGNASYFLILTTWDSEESWLQVEERHNPKALLLSSAPGLLVAAPEQWLMSYLWGYSRPAAEVLCADAHLAHIAPEQAELAKKGWIEALRRQARYPLAFGLLARGHHESALFPPDAPPTSRIGEKTEARIRSGPAFLNLLHWSSDQERAKFYADTTHQTIQHFIGTLGTMQVLPLEPF
jgi:hypothetical protein